MTGVATETPPGPSADAASVRPSAPAEHTRRIGERRGLVAAALVGAASFAYQLPIAIVDPTNIRWMMKIDRGAELSGWLFERNEPLTLPFGILHTMMAPLVTTVGYADGLPLVAAPAKILFGWIPVPWQFSGLFLLACYVLQAVFGYLVLRALGTGRRFSVLGAAFFALSPALLQRYEHVSLSAHWELLAAWWLYLRPPRRGPAWRYLLPWLVLVSISIPTYGYLSVMIAGMAAGAYIRAVFIDRLFPWWVAIGHALVAGATTYAVFWIFGYFVLQNHGEPGFGRFYADVLAFFNSAGSSRFLPAIPRMAVGWWGNWGLEWDGYELYYYLGLGVIALIPITCALSIAARRRSSRLGRPDAFRWPPMWPGVVAALVLFVYAWSTPVRLAGHEVLSIPLYAHFPNFTAWFRGTGRFAWPLYYLLMAVTLAALARYTAPPVALAVAGAALVLQIADLRPLRATVRADYSYPFPELEAPVWQTLGRSFRSMRLVPPIVYNRIACRRYDQPSDYEIRFGVVAAEQHMAFNSADPARVDLLAPLCVPMLDSLQRGLLDDRTVYIPSASFREAIQWWAGDRVVCGTIEGANVCTARSGPNAGTPLTRALREQTPTAPPIVLHFDMRADDPGPVDSTTGFGVGDSLGRRVTPPAAAIYYSRPLAGRVTITVTAVAPGASAPQQLAIGVGQDVRAISVGPTMTTDTLRLAGGAAARVLRLALGAADARPNHMGATTSEVGGGVWIRSLTVRLDP